MNSDDPFTLHRDRLHAIAYRMTGSVSDADDIVQEAWLRWERTDTTAVESPEAWLVRATTNLAIDRSRSIARRRESYVGPYLPEPLLADARPQFDDPAHHAELVDSLTFAFLVMLDRLEPIERAVLLLHDVFGYSFSEIAPIVERTSASCRQIASRTRRRLDDARVARKPIDEAHDERMLNQLVVALGTGDIDAVVALLSPHIVVTSDGGNERHAARREVVGIGRASRFLVNLAKRQTPTMTFEFVRSNGAPALVVRDSGNPFQILTIACADDGRIARVFSVLNPSKLRALDV